MVHLTVTFIPAAGFGAKELQINDFDVTNATGLSLRQEIAREVSVPSEHLQMFYSGRTLEDTDKLIDMALPKNVKILASVQIPSAFRELHTSSPLSTTSSTPTPGPDSFLISPTSTNKSSAFSPLAFDHSSPSLDRVQLSKLTVEEFLQKLLPMAHVEGTAFAEAAKEGVQDGPTSGLVDGFVSMITSSIPPQHLTASINDMKLPNPLEGLPMTQQAVAGFELEQCDYSPLLQIRSTFESLPGLTAEPNKQFATEASRMFQALYDLLNGTKNKSIFSNATAMAQRIANPHFVRQYTLQSEHPIATNGAMVDMWDALAEARVMMMSAQEAIDRSVYTDDVRVQLTNVISLASGVETQINLILSKLEDLKVQYQGFPSVDPLKNAELASLKELTDSYHTLFSQLQTTSKSLEKNASTLKAKYEQHKAELARKVESARTEVSRLSKEQNLILSAIDILGRMHIEHEAERQKQLQLLDLYYVKGQELDKDNASFQSEASKHSDRVASATKDTQAALSALDLLNGSVQTQMRLLQQWVTDAKSQHTDAGIRVLNEAHHTALVKFNALVEIWDSAKRSIEDITPELARLHQEILSASTARSQVRVESATRAKKDVESQLPIFEQRRDAADKDLVHLETVVFPAINSHLATYGHAPIPIPLRNIASP